MNKGTSYRSVEDELATCQKPFIQHLINYIFYFQTPKAQFTRKRKIQKFNSLN